MTEMPQWQGEEGRDGQEWVCEKRKNVYEMKQDKGKKRNKKRPIVGDNDDSRFLDDSGEENAKEKKREKEEEK